MDTDVLVIGGGATGAGLAWDFALRGVRVTLVEMGDLATGTSGRYHGLLHSGGRYAVRDLESAKECIDENLILRKIAAHALEDTGGFFIFCPGDDPAYVDQWLQGCAACGIPTHEISVGAALKRERVINPRVERVFEVPDGTCDSWDLAHALKTGTEQAGGTFLTYHRVEEFVIEQNRVVAARALNLRTNETITISCNMVVNAAGPWAAEIAAKAGAVFNMRLSRGAMLAFNVRWVNTVINRLRKPGDGDIFVPVGTVSVAGTTSVKTDDPGDCRVEPWEVERVLSETEIMTPGISRARVLRAWGGVRPLYDPGGDGRSAARTFAVLDHSADAGIEGMVSIVGGKLTTFRLMAEKTADLVCAKLGVTAPCVTASTELPTVEGGRSPHYHHLRHRLNQLEHGETPGALICECELVTAPQIQAALRRDDIFSLNDLRRDLRLGMGPCQGGFCSYRAAGLRHETLHDTPEHTRALLTEFVERRFGGVKPLLWGHNLRQALLAEHLYGRILGLSQPSPPTNIPTPSPSPSQWGGGGEGTQSRIVVVGAGLAGLMAALTAATAGAQVELIAQGQGALTLHPGWLEVGDVFALAGREGHPYAYVMDSLLDGIDFLNKVLPVTPGVFTAVTGMGTARQVAYAAGGELCHLSPESKILIVGIDGWRDFYPRLIADNLIARGFQAQAAAVYMPHLTGSFDEWTIDLARYLDTPAGLNDLIAQVKPQLDGATAVGFPAVLGFQPKTRRSFADALGCAIFEIPTLTPSIPGLRLYRALRQRLLDLGARITIGSSVVGLEIQDRRVVGAQAQTASHRPRLVMGDAVILATGGLFGGGLDSDYQGNIRETIGGFSIAHLPEKDAWFDRAFLSGEPQPIHYVGVATDSSLRPLNDEGKPAAPNLYAAGRLLSGYSPVSEGSVEGVDIASGVFAAQAALAQIGETVHVERKI